MISVREATALLDDSLEICGTEKRRLADCAGHVLRQSIFAERDQPPFDRATMDGIAVRLAADRRRFAVAGTSMAGDPQATLPDAGACIEVMTGAALPAGCDTVIPVEDIVLADGRAELRAGVEPASGQFVHRRGSDHAAETELLVPGTVLGPCEVAVVASAGMTDVSVNRKPRCAVIATGNELVAPGEPILPHQIRLSNGPAIMAALRLHGFSDSSEHLLPDAPGLLTASIGRLLDENDVLVLSGGVSMGKADYVPSILSKLGVTQVFHRVAQRPGKPLWFGRAGRNKLVFGLPGNPVSVLVCFHRYVVPALYAMSGLEPPAAPEVALADAFEFPPPLTGFFAARYRDLGAATVELVRTNTSGDFAALAGTVGFVELDADRAQFPAGFRAPLRRWFPGSLRA